VIRCYARNTTILACLLLWAQPVWAAFGTPTITTTCGSGCDEADNFDDNAMASTMSAVSGDLLVAVFAHGRATPRTVTSVVCGANTLAEAHRTTGASFGGATDIYFVRATASCSSMVATLSGSGGGAGNDFLGVLVVTGSVDPAAETGTSAGEGTTGQTSHCSACTITPGSTEVFFVGLSNGTPTTGNYDAHSDFTEDTPLTYSVIGYRVQSATTARTFSVTTADMEGANTAFAAFEGASGGAANPLDGLIIGGGLFK